MHPGPTAHSPRTEASLRVVEDAVLFRRPRVLADVRVQVVVPALAALFADAACVDGVRAPSV
jgi:hypothetical protein